MKKFGRVLKMECGKAMKNPFFFAALIIGGIFAFLSVLYNVGSYHMGVRQMEISGGNPMIQALGLYNMWMGGEGQSMGFTLFFTLFPLLAIFPYGWSHCAERRTGYTRMAVTRCGKRQYFLAKYIAVFLSGGLTVLLPLVFNFVATACFIPAVRPFIQYQMYYGMGHGSMWSELFYERPLVFVLMYLFLDFVFAGLFAAAALGLSVYIRNQAAVVILPFLLILCLHYARTLLYYKVYIEISPLHFLHATCIENSVSGAVVFLEGFLLFLFSFGSIVKAGVADAVW